MIKHPRTATEWAEVRQEVTIDGLVGMGTLLSQSLPLRFYPDPFLTKISEPVEEFNEKLALLCEQMHITMFYKDGIGLSAVQVGELKRVITMKIPETLEENGKIYDTARPYNFINPEIIDSGGSFTFSEGCLSIPNYFEDRERAETIFLRFQTIRGDQMTEQFDGLEAFVIQHEIDHLDGKLFIDDLSPLKKERIGKKIRKATRNQNG